MYVYRPDAKIFYQATGGGSRDIVLCSQCQPVSYSRMWKYQIPYLSRYFRVVTFDQRGNGRSDRPVSGYDLDTRYEDLTEVADATARPPFALVALSCAAMLAFRYVVEHPERVSHLILIAGQYSESVPQPFEEKVASVIRSDFDGWRQRLFKRVFQEPHSLKGIEDMFGWAVRRHPTSWSSRSARSTEPACTTSCLASPRRPSCSTARMTRSSPTPTPRSSRRRCPGRAWSPSRAAATRSRAATR
jgi:pimeloyl-ACP methyl ester carboxylesterase